jgi:hypothetical protein
MTTIAHEVIKGLVKDVLQHPYAHDREWTIQGLGMLRTYFGPEVRLHVWDQRFAWCHTSRLHTHPWDFKSLIVAGKLRQHRYVEALAAEGFWGKAEPFIKETVHCGYEFKDDPQLVHLIECKEEVYVTGDWYGQRAKEIHDSMPENGTVTIVHRRFLADTETASIYRPAGQVRENAGARRATPEEVRRMTDYALNTWFKP